MEKQHERTNPLRKMAGGSATPSMGLSEVRGGYHSCSDSDSSSDDERHGGARMMGRQLSDHILHQHGRKFYNEFKGGFSFGDLFGKIKNEFTNKDSVLRGKVLPEAAKYSTYAAPVLDVAGTAVGLPGAGTMLSRGLHAAQYANQGARALGYGHSVSGCGSFDLSPRTGAYEGKGRKMVKKAVKAKRQSALNKEALRAHQTPEEFAEHILEKPSRHSKMMRKQAKMMGMGRESEDVRFLKGGMVRKESAEEKERKGDPKVARDLKKGKGKRAPAGPHDGRRKRAEIVKKVMADKGMKMIEASKYVKEHGLY